jgi:DNA invertase Pin-like site-specific DNA recombinase
MKVALYARVSKSDDSQNPENQLMRLRSYARGRGWEVFGEYVDKASGADDHRPELDRMMNDARARYVGLVLTTKIDRIARSARNLLNILEELKDRGVLFECTDQPFSTSESTGRFLTTVLGAVAELERDLISERTKAGLARTRAKGTRLGHPPLKIDMARARQLRSDGMGYRKIAKALGVSHQTIKNRLRTEGVEPPKESPRPEGA